MKFGGTWEPSDLDRATGGSSIPARVVSAVARVPRPASTRRSRRCSVCPDGSIRSQADLLRLPVVTFILGIGDRAQPSYNLDDARNNNRYHLYVQDSWQATDGADAQLRPRMAARDPTCSITIWRSRRYLAPIYGSDLSPTKKNYKNFSPAAGFAWSIGKDRPTVIRGGAGIFYDTQLGWWRLGERAVIGGSGRQFIFNNAVINPLTGQPFSTAFLNSLALQLRHVPAADAGAARAAGRQVSRHRRPAADSAVEAGHRARRAVPARVPDHARQPLQSRVPARAGRRHGWSRPTSSTGRCCTARPAGSSARAWTSTSSMRSKAR